jgi:ammonia channel protein AmtB
MHMDIECLPGKASVNTVLCGAIVGLFAVMPLAFLGDSWSLVLIGLFSAVS